MVEPIIRKLYPDIEKQWCAVCKSHIIGMACYQVTIPVGVNNATAQFSFCVTCFEGKKLEISAAEDYTTYAQRILKTVVGSK